MISDPVQPEPERQLESSSPPAMGPTSPKLRWPAFRRVLWLIGKLAILIGVIGVLWWAWAGVSWAESDRLSLVRKALRSGPPFLFLLALFSRDFRLLGRYLGPPKRPFRAVLTVVVVLLIELALTVSVFAVFHFLLPRELSRPDSVNRKFIMKNIIQPIVDSGEISLSTALAMSSVCVVGPIMEELIFRGVLFLLLLRLAGKWPAVVLTSTIFAGLHQIGMDGVNWLMVSVHTTSGLALCTVLLLTHRLRWCILLHSIWNSGLTLVLILVFVLL